MENTSKIKAVPIMKKLKDEPRQDVDGVYRHLEYDLDGHLIEVNSDEYGLHGRVDGDRHSTVPNMNEGQFSIWIVWVLRKIRGLK